jgi:hypothetical protein
MRTLHHEAHQRRLPEKLRHDLPEIRWRRITLTFPDRPSSGAFSPGLFSGNRRESQYASFICRCASSFEKKMRGGSKKRYEKNMGHPGQCLHYNRHADLRGF